MTHYVRGLGMVLLVLHVSGSAHSDSEPPILTRSVEGLATVPAVQTVALVCGSAYFGSFVLQDMYDAMERPTPLVSGESAVHHLYRPTDPGADMLEAITVGDCCLLMGVVSSSAILGSISDGQTCPALVEAVASAYARLFGKGLLPSGTATLDSGCGLGSNLRKSLVGATAFAIDGLDVSIIRSGDVVAMRLSRPNARGVLSDAIRSSIASWIVHAFPLSIDPPEVSHPVSREKPRHPLDLPAFDLCQRLYKTVGRSRFVRCEMRNGLSVVQLPGEDCPSQPLPLDGGFTNLAEGPSRRYSIRAGLSDRESIDRVGHDAEAIYYLTLSSGAEQTRKIRFRTGYHSLIPLGWLTKKDLYYFMIDVGITNNRAYLFYEFDPASGRLEEIGSTNGVAILSPDARWILWATPDTDIVPFGSITINVSHLRAYRIDTRENFALTEGHSIERFVRWK